ncbi:GP46-like surface antigen, putative, partial [Bodo saltans]
VISAKVPDVSGITSLQSIYLSLGTLGTLNWTSMVNLMYISLTNCSGVTGALPSAWNGTSFPSLMSITLRNVSVSGALPVSWGSISTLTVISISSCSSLSATLPTEWANLAFLQSLSIVNTAITGSLPSSWNTMLQVSSISIIGANLSATPLPNRLPPWLVVNIFPHIPRPFAE